MITGDEMSKIYVIGIGPGSIDEMTLRAKNAIENSDVIIGYSTYIELIQEFFPEKNFIASGMTREVERCNIVLEKAKEGLNVALISSGDSGIYGMAGIMLEVAGLCEKDIDIEIIPGITSAVTAAAILGAPLTHDFAVISLSDLLTPWDLICRRLECAAAGDFVICLYNPKSKNRSEYIGIAQEIILRYRNKNTPVGIVKNAGRKAESKVVTTLECMSDNDIDMFTVVIIGNSATYVENGKIITPRGYKIKTHPLTPSL
jgi:precorrin-3B C17-methyltransferase